MPTVTVQRLTLSLLLPLKAFHDVRCTATAAAKAAAESTRERNGDSNGEIVTQYAAN